jgi:cytochrome c556
LDKARLTTEAYAPDKEIRMKYVAIAAFGLLAACQQPAANQAESRDANAATVPAEAPKAAGLGPAPSREAALKLMHDRHEDMERIGKAVKATGRALKSDSPDLAVIRSSAEIIARLSPQIPSWFPAGTGPDVGKTHAKPAIWEKPEDFVQKARDFDAVAKAHDAAARGGDVNAIKASFADLGKSCKSCHDPYRAKDD